MEKSYYEEDIDRCNCRYCYEYKMSPYKLTCGCGEVFYVSCDRGPYDPQRCPQCDADERERRAKEAIERQAQFNLEKAAKIAYPLDVIVDREILERRLEARGLETDEPYGLKRSRKWGS